jgi:hypothetical protein
MTFAGGAGSVCGSPPRSVVPCVSRSGPGGMPTCSGGGPDGPRTDPPCGRSHHTPTRPPGRGAGGARVRGRAFRPPPCPRSRPARLSAGGRAVPALLPPPRSGRTSRTGPPSPCATAPAPPRSPRCGDCSPRSAARARLPGHPGRQHEGPVGCGCVLSPVPMGECRAMGGERGRRTGVRWWPSAPAGPSRGGMPARCGLPRLPCGPLEHEGPVGECRAMGGERGRRTGVRWWPSAPAGPSRGGMPARCGLPRLPYGPLEHEGPVGGAGVC